MIKLTLYIHWVEDPMPCVVKFKDHADLTCKNWQIFRSQDEVTTLKCKNEGAANGYVSSMVPIVCKITDKKTYV